MATLLDGGNTKFMSTTLPNVGLAVTRLLSLPLSELERYRNKHVYISSFGISQREILDSVQRATNTTDKDWTIEHTKSDIVMEKAKSKFETGDMTEIAAWVYATNIKESFGGDYAASGRAVAHVVLGLPDKDLNAVTAEVISGM
ncbi:hypothetical protein LTR66_015691, partial [Elasticomyces elasticus]